MLHLALKAFRPGRLPFPVMHVDTGHNFDEVIATRDELVAAAGVRLVVASVQDDIDAGRVVETIPSRNPIQTVTLLRAIRENQFDAAFGEPGATRRRPAPRSGCSASATSSASGTRRLSGRNCGTSTTDGTTRASTSGSSAVQLDRIRHLVLHRRRAGQAAVHLFRPPAQGVSARRHVAGRAPAHATASRRAGVRGHGAIPHRRGCYLHRVRRVVGIDGRGSHRRNCGGPLDGARGDQG